MDTQQIFQNLTLKFLKPHLAKANSEMRRLKNVVFFPQTII